MSTTPSERLAEVIDMLDRFDESCEDDLCECCGLWRGLISDIRSAAG